MFNLPLLSTLIGLSFVGSLFTPLVASDHQPHRASLFASAIMMGCFILSGLLGWHFDVTQSSLQFKESYLWINIFNIKYALGIDGLSLSLILLTVFITGLVVLTSWRAKHAQLGHYLGCFFLIQALMIISFAATDAMLFYMAWEAILIPVIFIIGIWGSQKRVYASIKLFLYTFLGSTGLLAALLYLGHQQAIPSFIIQDFYLIKLNWTEQIVLFSAFFIAFTVKVPLWPLHTWLPDAHTEAPAEGSMVLAALMLKLGSYGLLRFCLPIVPDVTRFSAPFVCALSFIAIIYAGLVALAQTDMKRLVAYSSISHMGIVVLGIFVIFLNPSELLQPALFQRLALEGASFQMIAHALSSAGLFLCIGLLYQRFHSRQISDYQGLASMMPLPASICLLFLLSAIGLPGTAGFVGEFLIIISAVRTSLWVGWLAAITLLLSAAYTLWFYIRVFWGELHHPASDTIEPLHWPEKIALYSLAISVLLMGIWPAPMITMMRQSLETILQLSMQTKL